MVRRRTFRALSRESLVPAWIRRALAAAGLSLAALVCRAAEPQAATAPSAPAATDAAPADAYQRVKVFDFDERPLGNYEDTPMHWTRLTGPGLPAYSRGRFDEQVGHQGAPSFLLALRGENMAYEYAQNDLPVSPDMDYLVVGYVRAVGLEFARAFMACYLVDAAGRRIAGSEGVSSLVYSRGVDADDEPWQRVEIAVPSRFPDAVALHLQLWVAQRHVFAPPTGVDPIVRQDVNARVWFDDLANTRITAENARLNFLSTNLKVAGENVTLAGANAESTPNACTGKFIPMPIQ